MNGDNNNKPTTNNNDPATNNKEQNDELEENKDIVNEINDGEDFINEEDIAEIEEIDKEALKNEMDIDDDDNNNNNNNIENLQNNDNEKEDTEIYSKEYPDFQAKGEIYSINFHKDSGTLIIGDGEDTTYFYDLNNKKILKEEKYNKDSVNFIKFSKDNKYMLTASIDGSINIFNTKKNFELIDTITDQDSEINWIEWHPKGPVFAFGTAEGAVWVYMATNKNNNFNFYNHTESCTCGAFIDDGKKLISGGEDAAVKIYELKEKKVEFNVKNKKFIKNPITCLDVCKSKNIVVVCSIANEFSIVNYQNGNVVFYTQYPCPNENGCSIESVCFCYNDQYIVFADAENHLNIFEMKSMNLRSSITVNGENLIKITPSVKKSYEVICSGSNGNMYIFDTRGVGSVLLKEKVHSDVIMDYVVTENENFIITSSIDKTINLVKIVDIE